MQDIPRKYIPLLIIILILSSFIGINAPKSYFGDEVYYLSSSFNMVKSHDWLTPVHEGEIRFQKPILFYWLVAGSYKVFGISLLAARLPSILAMAALVWVVWLLARMLFNFSNVGFYSALVFLTMPMTIWYGRTSMTDMTLSLFMTSAFYFGLRGFLDSDKRRMSFFLSYVFMGLGVLTKGIAGLFFPMSAIILYEIICGNEKKAFLRYFHPLNLLIFFAIVLPWHLMMWVYYGERFTSHILSEEIAGRLGFSFWKPIHGIIYYLGVMLRYCFPWFILILLELFRKKGVLRKTWQSHRKSFIPLVIFLGLIIISYAFFIIDERARYLLPASVVISIYAGICIQQALENNLSKTVYIVLLCAYSIIAVVIGILSILGLYAATRTDWISPTPFFVILIVTIVGFSITLFFFKKREYCRFIATVSVMFSISANLLLGWLVPSISRSPVHTLAQSISREDRRGDINGCGLSDGEIALLKISLNENSHNVGNNRLESYVKSKGKACIIIKKHDFEKYSDEIKSKFDIVDESFGFDRIDASSLFRSIFYGRIGDYLEGEKIKYILIRNQTTS
jgi:4-amino-4-deoxy-L-arabinose transferase-like glycosyltransferase